MPLKELLEAMERALEDLEDERMRMEEECDAVLEKVKTVVGEMSDLRYGKLANPGTEKQAMAQLKYLTEVCERKLAAADEVAGGGGTDVDRDVEMS